MNTDESKTTLKQEIVPDRSRQVRATKSRPERRKVKTKIAYEYPKGRFRFPLIPDETGRHTYQVSDPSTPHIAKQDVADQTTSESVKKKPFIPTEVPSPVFAYQNRPSRFEFNLDENSEQASRSKKTYCIN
ncbi:hypothetical protein [Listeria floridensis]|uniref:hypothetical protein n=1 Tax=Listeria floridensis TaxID=1494962 RepID=UPI0004B8CED9|nr:hypothetical protein [Listeria floridensis]